MQPHYRMVVAYDGTAYHGWQIQREDRSVEEELTRAAARILDCELDQVKVQGASRTDSGVHAHGQVAHIAYDVDRERTTWDFVRGLNGLTDDDICVVFAEPAPEGFHARFSSTGKLYRYEIWNHRFPHPMRRRYAWRAGGELDFEAMRRAARMLEGTHDFAAFRGSNCSAETTERHLHRVELTRDGPRLFVEVEGDAFLQYMVRVIVGTLVYIGWGRREPQVIERMFETGDRAIGGITAPPHGLSLIEVFYPDHPWPLETPRLGARVRYD
ncbi:MAG: tRNA pseudouridine(38-40) synthase TruA [Persicimonas sp.]